MKKIYNKKAQIGSLFSNFIMTIILVIIIALFVVSSSTIKLKAAKNAEIHDKLVNLEMYFEQLSNYQFYYYNNPNTKLECYEFSIYRLIPSDKNLLFTVKNEILNIKQSDDVDWKPFLYVSENDGIYQLSETPKEWNIDPVKLVIEEETGNYYNIEIFLNSFYQDIENRIQKYYKEQIEILKNSNLIEGVGYDC